MRCCPAFNCIRAQEGVTDFNYSLSDVFRYSTKSAMRWTKVRVTVRSPAGAIFFCNPTPEYRDQPPRRIESRDSRFARDALSMNLSKPENAIPITATEKSVNLPAPAQAASIPNSIESDRR